jgi:uncharacterized protein (DUF4415 family)
MTNDENPEWTVQDFKEARPLKEIMPPKFFTGMNELAAKRQAELKRVGRPPLGTVPKKQIGFRLDAALVERIRASGPGYGARVEKALYWVFMTSKTRHSASSGSRGMRAGSRKSASRGRKG